jgi:hypothetical protein
MSLHVKQESYGHDDVGVFNHVKKGSLHRKPVRNGRISVPRWELVSDKNSRYDGSFCHPPCEASGIASAI